MIKFMTILLGNNVPSFCHYEVSSKCNDDLIQIGLLRKAIHYAMINNLYVQVVYPDREIPTEHQTVIEDVDSVGISSFEGANSSFADVIIFNDWAILQGICADSNKTYILRTNKKNLFVHYSLLAKCWRVIPRLNLVITDIQAFTKEDLISYKETLSNLNALLLSELKDVRQIPRLNILTDRLFLTQMNNCNSGVDSITVGPDGMFYICPAFYEESFSCGNLADGLQIVNQHLYSLRNAPICSLCDAFQCKRCVWLNKLMTDEINTPSHEQCVIAHLERNAAREFAKGLEEDGFDIKTKIPEITYLDPFEKI